MSASNRIRVKTKQREQTFISREQQSPRVTSHYIFHYMVFLVGFYCMCLCLGLVENKVQICCLPFITVRIVVIVLFLIIEPCLTTVYQDAPLISLV